MLHKTASATNLKFVPTSHIKIAETNIDTFGIS